MLVLGVDPGSHVTGYGLVNQEGHRLNHIASGRVRLSSKAPFFERIHRVFQSMLEIMDHYGPEQMAIEDVFFSKNVKSSLKLGHARGAVLVAAVQKGLRIFEYTPLEIKKSIVGYGRADKEQVRSMVRILLNLKGIPDLDTSDALAAAICHLNWSRFDSGLLSVSPVMRR